MAQAQKCWRLLLTAFFTLRILLPTQYSVEKFNTQAAPAAAQKENPRAGTSFDPGRGEIRR